MTIDYTTGYAGTGKSTELLKLIPTLPKETTVILCPTHKAIARLTPSLPSGYEVSTIHAILGWVPTINEDAEEFHHIESTMKLDKALEAYTNIVIDEGGMMSEEMLMDITSKLEEQCDFDTDHITISIFLDPYQLKPVKGVQIQTDPYTTTNLTIQHRGESPDVVALFTKFVTYLQGNNLDLTTPYSENVLPLDITKFKKGDRLVAYTNKAVGEWNKQIASKFGITTYVGQEVQLGSKLDTFKVERFVKPTFRDILKAYANKYLELQDGRIDQRWLDQNLRAMLDNPNIQFIESDNKLIPVIVGIGNANEVLNDAKLKALDDKKYFRDVYALNRAFIMDYNFATTVHKAQGSEFDTVFVDKLDIQKSIFRGHYETYARLMYVGISRAKKRIYI